MLFLSRGTADLNFRCQTLSALEAPTTTPAAGASATEAARAAEPASASPTSASAAESASEAAASAEEAAPAAAAAAEYVADEDAAEHGSHRPVAASASPAAEEAAAHAACAESTDVVLGQLDGFGSEFVRALRLAECRHWICVCSGLRLHNEPASLGQAGARLRSDRATPRCDEILRSRHLRFCGEKGALK